MSPPTTVCLTLTTFQQFTDRSTDADDVRRWASHLAGCAKCIATTLALQAEAVVVQAMIDRFGPWEPLLAAVKVTGPTTVGVTVNVWAAAELLKVRMIGALKPPPAGVIVIVPV